MHLLFCNIKPSSHLGKGGFIMRKFVKFTFVLGVTCFLLWSSSALAAEFLYEQDGVRYYKANDGRIAAQHFAHGVLPNAPDYNWWYGCSPTSAGMMMGYYDINGYNGLCYDNLVPGGTAELSNYGNPSAIANDAIASPNHIADYWGYPDPCAATGCDQAQDDCLASFMETSKGAMGDGWSSFWYWNDGSPMTPSDIEANGWQNTSGMYGVKEYVEYREYEYSTLYNQYIDDMGLTYGFTAAQYRAEIDAGRPVMIHVIDHTMFGYGYDYDPIEQMTTVYVRDTWTEGEHTFTWGHYYSGLEHYGVTVLTVSDGDTCDDYDYCLTDSYGYTWYLDVIDSSGGSIYLAGKVEMGSGTRNAVAIYRSGVLSMSADAGGAVAFNYLINWGTKSGAWTNISASAGHGTVTISLCGSEEELTPSDGPAPGVENDTLSAGTNPAPQGASYCITDSYGYTWNLDVIESSGGFIYLAGTVETGSGTCNAVAIYQAGWVSMSADESIGVAFNYLINWGTKSGAWTNIAVSPPGHGTVTVSLCGSEEELTPSDGPAPGVE
jgi:hypothetical protein